MDKKLAELNAIAMDIINAAERQIKEECGSRVALVAYNYEGK